MKVEIRDDLLLNLEDIAKREGRSCETLIEQVLELFLAEQERAQALVDIWKGDDAGDFVEWLQGALRRR